MNDMFRIGSRESRLAMVQSETVREYLEDRGIPAQIIPVRTKGDIILDRPLEKIGGKGLFVKELELALREGRIDLSVHSLKDVPVEMPKDLPLVGFSRREDPRDVLVLPVGATELARDKPIGCSSRRRVLQGKKLFPAMEFASVRGNVLTRLQKLDSGQYSGLILAAAGLKRLGLSGRISKYFTVEEMIPSAGQGILALQGRADRGYPELQDYCQKEAAMVAACERTVIRCLAGDCTAPVAAYAEVVGQELVVRGMYGGDGQESGDLRLPQGGVEQKPEVSEVFQENNSRSRFVTSCLRGSLEQPEQLGRELAGMLLQQYSDGSQRKSG